MTDHIQQAADVIRPFTRWGNQTHAAAIAHALAAAGLLVTPEQRNVLDAAEAFYNDVPYAEGDLLGAVAALRAATPKEPT